MAREIGSEMRVSGVRDEFEFSGRQMVDFSGA